ncbi:MAG: class II aldolase/adducin family protein, partial [Lentimicrobium sp.]|nr:class II aldolase/adducin family protein [Lentimicrobium sp.]
MKKSELEDFVHWAHEAGKQGLVKCSSGNMSQRLGDGTMLISATGTWLSEITVDDISHISVDNEIAYNTIKPSAENRLHRQIFQKRPDINT